MIYVIADDLTGANDTGVQFSKKGYNTIVSIVKESSQPVIDENTDVFVVDTETRDADPNTARKRVRFVLNELNPGDKDIIYKKVDSTLRGSIGHEIEEIMNILKKDICLFSPTFSINQRIAVGGYLVVQGEILGHSKYYSGNMDPDEASYIPSLLKKQTALPLSRIDLQDVTKGQKVILKKINKMYERGVKIIIIDATDEAHLHDIFESSLKFNGSVLYSGSAGLANHISQMCRRRIHYSSNIASNNGLFLAVYATRNPIMKSQIDYLKGKIDFYDLIINVENIFSNKKGIFDQYSSESVKALNDKQHVIIHTDPLSNEKNKINEKLVLTHVLSFRELELIIRNFLGELTAEIVKQSSVRKLILSGGDTALGVCSALGIHNLHILNELLPGIPVSTAHLGDFNLNIVTKAGGFGEEDTLHMLIKKISNLKEKRVY